MPGNGERTRTVQVLKSRGMAHSNKVREFTIGSDGIELIDEFLSGRNVLTGPARRSQQARDLAGGGERR
jgi:circadian clock protein KaiC